MRGRPVAHARVNEATETTCVRYELRAAALKQAVEDARKAREQPAETGDSTAGNASMTKDKRKGTVKRVVCLSVQFVCAYICG